MSKSLSQSYRQQRWAAQEEVTSWIGEVVGTAAAGTAAAAELAAAIPGELDATTVGVNIWTGGGGDGIPAKTAGSGTGKVSGDRANIGEGACEFCELVTALLAITSVPNSGTLAASGLLTSTTTSGATAAAVAVTGAAGVVGAISVGRGEGFVVGATGGAVGVVGLVTMATGGFIFSVVDLG